MCLLGLFFLVRCRSFPDALFEVALLFLFPVGLGRNTSSCGCFVAVPAVVAIGLLDRVDGRYGVVFAKTDVVVVIVL